MARDLEVEARLTLKDDLSRKAGTALDAVGKKARNARQQAERLSGLKGDGGANQYIKAAQAAEHAALMLDRLAEAARRVNAAQSRTGANHGLGQIARDAAQAERNMGRLEAMARRTGTALSKIGGAMGTARDAGAGLMAGGYVMAQAVRKPVAYELQLAGMANVAYGERDAAGRIAGMKDLDAAIVDAVRTGGGSREQAASALNTMLAAGTGIDTAKNLLGVVQKAATAAQADPNELAMVLVKGIQQGQFGEEEAKAALEKAIVAGEAGQFELKDMARWLPQIMAAGKGMKGMAGYEQHLANLQAVAQVTGSSDQAGNAYFNLLGKLYAPDAAKNFEDFGVNLPKELSAAALNGEDPVTAFARLVEERVVNTNKSYKRIKAQLAKAEGPERQALLEQAAELLQGSAVGKVIQDREAMLGLVGVMNQPATKENVLSAMRSSEGAIDRSFEVVDSTTAARTQRAMNEKDIAATRAFDEVKPYLDGMLDGLRSAAEEFPRLTTAAYEAATAIAALAAASGVWSAFKYMRGGGKLFGGLGRKAAAEAGKVAAQAGGGAVLKGTALEAGGKAVAKAATGTVAKETMQAGAKTLGKGFWGSEAALAAYEVWQTEKDPNLTRRQKNQANMATYGGFGGTLAGAAGGAAVGSVFPLVGTGIGAFLGGLAGWWAGRQAGEGAGKLLYGDEQKPVEVTSHVVIELEGQKMYDAFLNSQSLDAYRR